MKTFILLSLLSLCGTAVSQLTLPTSTQNPRFFNCKNPGNTCSNGGTCDLQNGLCICPASYRGVFSPVPGRYEDCNIEIAFVCGIDCGPNGECQTEAFGSTCVCRPGYTGDRCQTSALELECKRDSMIVRFTPYGDFSSGSGYVESQSLCFAQTTPTVGQYQMELFYDSAFGCGGGATVDNTATTVSYSYTTIWRYTGLRAAVNYKWAFHCTFDTSSDVVYPSFLNVDPSDTTGLIQQRAADYVDGIAYTVTRASGERVLSTSALTLGEYLYFDFIADEGMCIEIKDITANNSLENNNDGTFHTAVLMSEGCIQSPDGPAVIISGPSPASDTNLTHWNMTIAAFLLDELDTVYMTVRFNKKVLPSQCTQTTSCGRRRKRQADPNASEVDTYNVFVINEPGRAEQQTAPRPEECSMSKHVMIGLIAMAAIICVLLVVSLVLGLRMLINRSRKSVDETN